MSSDGCQGGLPAAPRQAADNPLMKVALPDRSAVRRPRRAAAKASAPAATRSLERRVAYRFSLVATLSARALADMYTREFSLSMADWKTLAIVGHFEPIFPGAIAEKTSMLPEQVSRALDRLVTKGVVERSLDETDRRRVVVTLSPQGRKAFDRIESVRAAMEEDMLGTLTKAERESLFAILDKLEARAHRLHDTPDAWKQYA